MPGRSLELHAPGGPLQQLLQRLLGLGAKSWRIMSVLSLQLCGVLSCHADLAPQYAGSIQQLLLWGAADDPGQSGVVRVHIPACCFMPFAMLHSLAPALPSRLCYGQQKLQRLKFCDACYAALQGDPVDADSAAELAALMAPGDPQLAAAFGATELAPRVAALCLLRSWVEQAQQAQQAQQQQQGALQQPAPPAAAAAGLLMWRQLLALSASDPELGAARYGPLGTVHRKKVSI